MKEYKIISDKYFEHLLDDLNAHGNEGWQVALSTTEYGVTKVILEREKGNK